MSAPPPSSGTNIPLRSLRCFLAAVAMAIRPRFTGGIWQWVTSQKVPITSTQNTTYQGEKYDFDRFPVVASLLFGFIEHPTARELFIEKSVQTAFTTAAFFACAWMQCEGDPGNIIYIMHTRDAARQKLKDVIRPIFSSIPALHTTGKSESSPASALDSAAETITFPGGTFMIGGGQTVTALTSTPALMVIMDEAEQHGMMGKTSSFELARGRLTGADRGKLLAFSKPEKMATFQRDEKTGQWRHRPQLLALMDAEWVSGDQREFHCPCPHCGKWNPIHWEQIRYSHLNEALPGQPAQWNWDRFRKEVYWECPNPACKGRVHEGPQKHAMILAGSRAPLHKCWPPCPLNDRRESGMYPRPVRDKWSATVSALSDIAFAILTWDKLAERWINAQGDPTKIVNFVNEVLGKPERPLAVADTTVEHLRRLIPHPRSLDPLPWRIRDDSGKLSGEIPLLATQLHYLGMAIDRQRGYLKYIVRAFRNDGRSYLLDHGTLGTLAEIPRYIESTLFRTLCGVPAQIRKCFIDLGGDDIAEVYDFCYYHNPIIEGIRGVGEDATGRLQRNRAGGFAWTAKRPNCPERCVQYWEIDAQTFERHLYVKRFQQYDPRRHRPYAPAPYFPSDISDEYLRELTAMREVEVPTRKGSHVIRVEFQKVNTNMANDFGDCEKYLCAMDYIYGGRQFTAGLQEDEIITLPPGVIPDLPTDSPPENTPREYILKR